MGKQSHLIRATVTHIQEVTRRLAWFLGSAISWAPAGGMDRWHNGDELMLLFRGPSQAKPGMQGLRTKSR
jgi:hypothetical protein